MKVLIQKDLFSNCSQRKNEYNDVCSYVFEYFVNKDLTWRELVEELPHINDENCVLVAEKIEDVAAQDPDAL